MKKKLGRPPKGDQFHEPITIRLKRADIKQLELIAKSSDIKFRELCRRAVIAMIPKTEAMK